MKHYWFRNPTPAEKARDMLDAERSKLIDAEVSLSQHMAQVEHHKRVIKQLEETVHDDARRSTEVA